MCGLIAAINSNKEKTPVNDKIVDMYEEQYRRGTEGFGIITIDKNKKLNIKRATEPAKFMYDLHNNLEAMVLAHHRTPTSTKNKLSQTHPILVENNILDYTYYVMHNGMIRNCDELKDEHEKMGFIYTTEIPKEEGVIIYNGTRSHTAKYNDSESLAIEMVLYLEKKQSKVFFDGSAAFLIIKIDKKTNKAVEFIYGRHINPLNLEIKDNILTLASEGPGELIEEDKIFTINLSSNSLEATEQNLNFPIKEPTPIPSPFGFQNQKQTQNTTIQTSKKTIWTKEDQDEVDDYNAAYQITEKNWDNVMDFSVGEVQSLMEDFIQELAEEKLAYTANIEEYLMQFKQILKEAKGNAISYYRNTEENAESIIADIEGYTPKHYHEREVENDNNLGGERQKTLLLGD